MGDAVAHRQRRKTMNHPTMRREVQSPASSSHLRRPGTQVALAALAVLAALIGTVLPGAPAGASGRPIGPEVDGLAGPLSIDVTHRGDVLVGQGFAGLVSSVSPKGKVTDLVNEPGVSAVGEGPFGTVIYTVATEEGESLLKVRTPNGATRVMADLGAHEAERNPDAHQTYGAPDISDECAAQWPVEEAGPPVYTGIVESNPYSIAVAPWGVYVADAAANAIVLAEWSGRVRTAVVLPPQPLVIPDDPGALGLPGCAAGLTYNFEPVPTDIELSWRGAYATLLPGGPEDPSLGARGSVVKLDLLRGRSRPVVGGLFAATDMAVSPSGDIYVTELFGGAVTRIDRRGVKSTVAELPLPAAVEWASGRLYVAYDVFDSGKLTTLRP
jgi:hypothetical protein